jgi:hypothetical protein
MKALFGIRGEAGEITDWLIRDIRAALPLPAYVFPPPAIRRPPLGTGAPFRYTVEAKFRDLPGAALFSELACFDTPGEAAPFASPPQTKWEPDFDRLDEGERAFFFYWRHCFRQGEYPGGDSSKTDETYIRLYARELCLFTGPEEPPLNHFRELLRLWKTYRELFPGINAFLPQWLLDFTIIYGIDAGGLPLLFPLAGESGVPLLHDMYIHQHFIEENNLIGAADLRGLVPELSAPEDLFSSTGLPPDPRLIREFELAVNAVDRHLREHFRFRLFSFFYPPQTVTRSFTAFAGMAGAGYSSYTAEWIHFSGHPPLLRFLGDLFRYTEYWFNIKKGWEKQHKPPPLDEVWKGIVDPVLGFADQVPALRTGPSAAKADSEQPAGRRFRPGPKPVQLRLEFLDRLRAESDEVRELLGTEDKPGREEGPEAEKDEHGSGAGKGGDTASGTGGWKALGWDQPRERPGDGDGAEFWDGLGALEREALRIIIKGSAAGAELEVWARKNGTMTELIIDGINERFLALRGDLLVETVDEGPRIQSEYKEEVKKYMEEA